MYGKQICSPTVADDMVLVSLSKQGMDEMLDICWKYSQIWRYFYNAAKCKVVIFNDRPSKTNRHVFKIGPEPVDVSDSYCHLGIVCSKSLSTKVNIQDACTKLRGTYFSVVNGGIDVTSVNPNIVRTIYMRQWCYRRRYTAVNFGIRTLNRILTT